MERIRHVGMDVDKDGIDLAVFDRDGMIPSMEKRIQNKPQKIEREMTKLREGGFELRVCYEAGPCGYELKRQMDSMGIWCAVVAPGLVPSRPTDRVKTNRRDAIKLGQNLRAGQLESIHVPTPETEAVRDFVRCRASLKGDLNRRRQRLSKFLLRHGKVYGQTPWSPSHTAWLNRLEWSLAALKETFEEYVYMVREAEERIKRCDDRIDEYAKQEPWKDAVSQLRCFRGVDTLTAMGLKSEIEDFRRFPHARSFMSFLGLGVSEQSTGNTRRQGGITKSGNGYVRRLLVEAAWHYRHKPAVGIHLRQRRRGQPEGLIHMADKAMHRLYRRFHRLVSRGKLPTVAAVAVARELAGFIWASQTLHGQATV